MKTRNLIILFALNLTFLIAYSQNNDSLVTSIIDTTQSGYIIELDTIEVTIKVTEVKSGKETLITKQDRVKVYITGGTKTFEGRWEFIDENNIRVKKYTVPISVIENIKRRKMSKGGRTGLIVGVTLVVGAAISMVILAASITWSY